MTIIYFALGIAAVALLMVWALAAPLRHGGPARAAARRRRYVESHPADVNSGDVLAALLRGGLNRDQATMVTDMAAQRGITALTMWMWLQRHGAPSLSIAVAADMTQGQLLGHILSNTQPNRAELELFAAYNGLALDDLTPAEHPPRLKQFARRCTRLFGSSDVSV